jgi:serralysin
VDRLAAGHRSRRLDPRRIEADPHLRSSFLAFGPQFTGGVRVAAGDVNGDGRADIIAGTRPGAGPHVKVFSGTHGSVLKSLLAYGASFTGGVHVAAGDVDGDGRADITAGTGEGVAPHVKVLGAGASTLSSFLAGSPGAGGVFVGGGPPPAPAG